MDLELLEHLLHEPESQSLDFKQAQYRFERASELDKSELLKDVLAFANSWRRTPAYVLIGVREVKGGRSQVIGITDHIEDASLQQFVNSKTQRRVELSYEVVRVEGVEIDVIEIPIQDRPVYAENDYGKVKARVVYFRAGSSTREATPEEIARMGAQQSLEATPNLVLSWADVRERRLLSSPYLADRLLLHPRLPANTFDFAARPRSFLDGMIFRVNDNYSQELIEYCFQQALYVPLGLALTNESRSAARRVRFVGSIPAWDVPMVREYLDPLPQREYDTVLATSDLMLPTGDEVEPQVQRVRDRWEISVDFGDIRPRETVFTHSPIWLAAAVSSVVELSGDLFADNLPEPIQCSLEVHCRVEQRPMERDDALPYLRQ